MTIRYISTRGDKTPKGFTDVLLSGMAPDGGLYVPDQWPALDLAALEGKSYADIAFHVLKPFVGGDIPDDDLRRILTEVYENEFKHTAVAPLVQMDSNLWLMELFHGPTIAFKDYALQLLGRLFDYVLKRLGERVTIVGATSGDTGSAAIEGCRACDNIDIFILHPKGRTSDVQRRQMTSVDSPNVFNIALEGTFDDCQNAVKAMFADETFRTDVNLSAVNSINWARIAAQIVYYVAAGVSLGTAQGRKLSFAVPTGNFGNVYAAYCAKQMGLPIDRLIIGSNRNDILTRFFESGEMTKTDVEPSLSPSMDIQISSNFERFLFDLVGRDADVLRAKMDSFRQSGSYGLEPALMEKARALFTAHRCSDERTLSVMADAYRETGMLLDPHTAVGLNAAMGAGPDGNPVIALACAHAAKFPDAVQKATGIHPPLPPHLADLYERKEIFTVLPNDQAKLQTYVREKART